MHNLSDELLNFTDPYARVRWNASSFKLSANTLQVGYPTAGHKPQLQRAIEHHLKRPLERDIVPMIRAHETQNALARLPNVKNILGVCANKGGVGKSTLAAHLAVALARCNLQVGLLDADLYGPNQPQLFGITERANITEQGYQPHYKHGVYSMSMGYLVDSQTPLVWRGPMASNYYRQMLEKTKWPKLDYLILDLPPGTGDIMLSCAQKTPLSGMIIVTTPHTLSVQDTQKGIGMLEKMHLPLLGIIKNMAGFQCDACGHNNMWLTHHKPMQQLLDACKLPLLLELPLTQSLCSTTHQSPFALFEDNSAQSLGPKLMQAAVHIAAKLATRPLGPRGNFPKIAVT